MNKVMRLENKRESERKTQVELLETKLANADNEAFALFGAKGGCKRCRILALDVATKVMLARKALGGLVEAHEKHTKERGVREC